MFERYTERARRVLFVARYRYVVDSEPDWQKVGQAHDEVVGGHPAGHCDGGSQAPHRSTDAD